MKSFVVVVRRDHIAVSFWPAARPMAGLVWMKDVGLSVDWKDSTYFIFGRVAKMLRKTGGHLIGRLP